MMQFYSADNEVQCLEHERPLDECHRLAMQGYGVPLFDNCQSEGGDAYYYVYHVWSRYGSS